MTRYLIISLVVLLISGCSDRVEDDVTEATSEKNSIIEETTIEAEPTTAEPELLLGEVVDHRYRNNYFDVTMDVPIEWVILSEDEMMALMMKGQQVLEGQNEEVARELSEVDVLNLMGVFRYPMYEEVTVNPSFIITAEKLVESSGIIDGKTYLEASKKILEQTGLSYDLGYPGTKSYSDFREYAEFYGTIQVGDQEIRQRYVAFVSNGYIISCVMTYEAIDGESAKRLTIMMNDVLRK